MLHDCNFLSGIEFRFVLLASLVHVAHIYPLDHTVIAFFVISMQVLSFKEILGVRYIGTCAQCILLAFAYISV